MTRRERADARRLELETALIWGATTLASRSHDVQFVNAAAAEKMMRYALVLLRRVDRKASFREITPGFYSIVWPRAEAAEWSTWPPSSSCARRG